MPVAAEKVPLLSEFAEFLATSPKLDAIVKWKPSKAVTDHIRDLLYRQDEDKLDLVERQELENVVQAEIMLRSLKAQLMLQMRKRK